MIVNLTHNKVTLALHQLNSAAPGSAQNPLLVLHGLGEQSKMPPAPWGLWPGGIWALDFTGHGQSTLPTGGGYTCELLMSDVDIALARLGPCTILGRGLGAYIALLVAGGRPELTDGVVLADGPGLTGGGSEPTSALWALPGDQDGATPDKHALIELSGDLRPPDYATSFLRLLMANSEMETPLLVTAKTQPPWLAAVSNEPGVVSESISQAFDRYASQ